MMKINTLHLSFLLCCTGFLTACNNSSSDNKPSNPQTPPSSIENTQGRLVITNDDATRPVATVYDLKENKVLNTHAVKGVVSGVYSSPSHRYAVFLDRENNTVQFLDSGLFIENKTLKVATPTWLSYQLNGEKPTHYRSFNGQATIFYDGSDAGSSKFDLITDELIQNKAVASQTLPAKHHGVAEPRGEYTLSTVTPSDWTEALPKFVKSYQLHGDHFHEEISFNTPCEGLHGAASGKNHAVFGCLDGVLAIEQKGTQFKDFKINIAQRIGTLTGHENLTQVLGLASSGDIFVIDPENRYAQSVNWLNTSNNPELKRISYSFDAKGKYFLILDSTGYIHTIDTKTWETTGSHRILETTAEIAKSKIVANANTGNIYINDTANKTIIEFSPAKKHIVQKILLNDVPQQMAWVGIQKN